ncbi:MAG: hypothetical protein FJ083_17645 [Cyanobacteria bacterium K_Offshore_surface_m2_239]|nr:hypothetical protein [Cyanobacteria bacterium K_Offshore_surface_m2_239]
MSLVSISAQIKLSIMKTKRLALFSAFAALTTTWVDAGSVSAAIFTVGGQQYDITTFAGTYTTDTAKFNTASNGGSMPWWGNPTLADDFATTVKESLGLPFFGVYGPFFADEASGVSVSVSYWSGTLESNLVSGSASWTYAQARLVEVPGPLPLLGAAAAFNMSRRLRRRINSQPYKL